MLTAVIDSKSFEEKIKIFSSGLGGIFKTLLNKVGKQMISEAKPNAPRKTGKLANSINFIFYDENRASFTTRKRINKSNVWYSFMVERDRYIEPKNGEYLCFKVNGEFKKVKSVRIQGKPFMTPVFNNYFGNDSGKGYTEIANELLKMIEKELN